MGMNANRICVRGRSSWWIFAAILLLGTGLRVTYWAAFNPVISRDSAVYCKIAEDWHKTGESTEAFREFIGSTPPGYVYLLKLGIDLGIPVLWWGRCLAVGCGVLLLIPFYLIGRMIDRPWSGEILMLAAALHPWLGRLSVMLLREIPCLLGYVWCIWALYRLYLTRRWIWSLSAGFFCGLAFCLRYEALELLLLLAVVTLLPPLSGGRDLKTLLRQWAAGAVGFGIAAGFFLTVCGHLPADLIVKIWQKIQALAG